jgi:hypothetical protein
MLRTATKKAVGREEEGAEIQVAKVVEIRQFRL